MRDLKQLQKLAQNPHYKMSDAEKQALKELERESASPKEEVQRKGPNEEQKRVLRSKDNAAVKETGKVEKHSSDPVTE